ICPRAYSVRALRMTAMRCFRHPGFACQMRPGMTITAGRDCSRPGRPRIQTTGQARHRGNFDRSTRDRSARRARHWSNQCIGRNAIHLALARLQGDGKPRWIDDRGRKITVHGFRSTMATWAQEQRRDDGSRLFDQETIDGALAHFVGGVTGTYQRSQHLEARRKLASAWGAFASTSQPDAPLVPDAPNRVPAAWKKIKVENAETGVK